MSNIFLSSDHHIGHENILTFFNEDGSRVREFNSVEEMNEHIVDKHNSVVRTQDKVYFLGDFAFHKKHFHYLDRMNGEKILIKGNHDLEKMSVYLQYFKDVRAVHQLNKMVLTHIPIHPSSLFRWKANVHGHLHSNVVTMKQNGREVPDPRYVSVCMERINYTPISLEDVSRIVENSLEK